MDHWPVFQVPHVALEQRRSTGGIDASSQLPSGSVQMTGRVCMPQGSSSQICTQYTPTPVRYSLHFTSVCVCVCVCVCVLRVAALHETSVTAARMGEYL